MMVSNTTRTSYTSSIPRRYEGTQMYVSGNIDVEPRKIHRLNTDMLYHQYSQLIEALSSTIIDPTIQPHTPISSYRADEAMGNMILELLYPWRRLIDDADSRENVIALVRYFGLDSTANRLAYLDKLAEDDPEEEYIGLESLRRFANFVLARHLPTPKIGISPGGLAHAAWWAPDGILSMDFLPSGKIRFAAVLQDAEWDVRGILPPGRMMAKIEPFKRALDR